MVHATMDSCPAHPAETEHTRARSTTPRAVCTQGTMHPASEEKRRPRDAHKLEPRRFFCCIQIFSDGRARCSRVCLGSMGEEHGVRTVGPAPASGLVCASSVGVCSSGNRTRPKPRLGDRVRTRVPRAQARRTALTIVSGSSRTC
jgi:hypothetical protein